MNIGHRVSLGLDVGFSIVNIQILRDSLNNHSEFSVLWKGVCMKACASFVQVFCYFAIIVHGLGVYSDILVDVFEAHIFETLFGDIKVVVHLNPLRFLLEGNRPLAFLSATKILSICGLAAFGAQGPTINAFNR